ncbi:MBL fold metallo-hydrolase [Candidatus Woesearchaeota archaeon]|nr:MBL fold metallo-hydrolase [Candidatus Woesearchaeota archaeon]
MLDFQGVKIQWLGHAAFKLIYQDKTIYLDPFKIEPAEPADFIFITHSHFDHCSLEDIEKVRQKSTIIIATHDCAAKFGNNVKSIKPGETLELNDIKVTAVPAYNTHRFKSPGVPFHSKESNWCGYILDLGGTKIYHAGDTDKIPEMKDIQCDIALLPVGGTYTMDPEEAAQAANEIKPKIAIPMHWGDIVGKEEDSLKFSELAEVEVRLLHKHPQKPEKHFVP